MLSWVRLVFVIPRIRCDNSKDSGTSDLVLAGDVFDAYMKVTGAVNDDATGFLTITLAQFEQLLPLNFTFLGVGITFF